MGPRRVPNLGIWKEGKYAIGTMEAEALLVHSTAVTRSNSQ